MSDRLARADSRLLHRPAFHAFVEGPVFRVSTHRGNGEIRLVKSHWLYRVWDVPTGRLQSADFATASPAELGLQLLRGRLDRVQLLDFDSSGDVDVVHVLVELLLFRAIHVCIA